jgi:hypothetical protein
MDVLPLPTCRPTLGVVCYRLGRHGDAIACFERNRGEQGNHDLPADLYFLAMCYQGTGDAAMPARASTAPPSSRRASASLRSGWPR